MTKVTQQMIQLIYERIDFIGHGDDGIREGLEDVFALVEAPAFTDDQHYDTACDDRPDCTIAEHHAVDDRPDPPWDDMPVEVDVVIPRKAGPGECGVPGPDGLLCQRNAGHLTGIPHSAADVVSGELVKW